MSDVEDLLQQLPERHRRALEWFHANARTEQPWPNSLRDGTLLLTRAKGIYKPRWTRYALSIREALGSQYPHHAPTPNSAGTWIYRYFQESMDPSTRDDRYTNRGLLACMADGVPVGVLRQSSSRPNVRYRVLGLALVSDWQEGYFALQGLSSL